MNTDWFDLSQVTYTGVDTNSHQTPLSPTLSDLLVQWYDEDADAPAAWVVLTAGDGLVLEFASTGFKTAAGMDPAKLYARLRGLPFSATEKFLQVWWNVTPAFETPVVIHDEVVGGADEDIPVLYTLFAATPGLTPVVFQVTDANTGDPVGNVEIMVWDSTLTTPVVPLLRTTTNGLAKCGLPAGAYKVFAFLPYGVFTDQFPLDLTVGPTTTTLAMTLTQSTPALPVVPKITVFGWVLRPDYTPVPGTEVKLRLLNTPQMSAGGGSLTRYEMTALTDQDGKFELYPVAGMNALLTCEATGYSRKGFLPRGGSLNWKDFATETLPQGDLGFIPYRPHERT
jgi:hypothetical protein